MCPIRRLHSKKTLIKHLYYVRLFDSVLIWPPPAFPKPLLPLSNFWSGPVLAFEWPSPSVNAIIRRQGRYKLWAYDPRYL